MTSRTRWQRSTLCGKLRLKHLTVAYCRRLRSSQGKKAKNQMKTTKTLIASAAVAGLMAGSLPVRAYAASAPTQAGVSLQTLADKGTHARLVLADAERTICQPADLAPLLSEGETLLQALAG